MSPSPTPDAQTSGRHALAAAVAALIVVAAFVHLNVTLPVLGHLGAAVIALLFLGLPYAYAQRRGLDLEAYGLTFTPVARSLKLAALAMLVIFPLFAVGYWAFYEVACDTQPLKALVPPGMCTRYVGLAGAAWPGAKLGDWKFLEFCAEQWIAVAIPEELFFRGFLLALLEARFPPARRWAGGGLGRALILSSLAFAVVHLPRNGDPRALATFFPGLWFGWMRSATGSIFAGSLTHAGSNIFLRVLDLTLHR